MIEASKAPISVQEPLEHAVVVLPSQIRDEMGIYSGATAQLVKQLHAAGVDAAYLHDADHRHWNVLLGDVPTELIIGFVTSMAASVAWSIIQPVLRKMLSGSHEVQARVLRQRRGPDGTIDNTWFEYAGPVDGFLAALPQVDSSEGEADG